MWIDKYIILPSDLDFKNHQCNYGLFKAEKNNIDKKKESLLVILQMDGTGTFIRGVK